MSISANFQAVIAEYNLLENSYHELTTKIAQLTQAGTANAKEFWRDEKYLYLIFPMKNGQRKKVYVGSHPLRIKEAQAKIANYHARAELIEKQDQIEKKLAWFDSMAAAMANNCRPEKSRFSDMLPMEYYQSTGL